MRKIIYTALVKMPGIYTILNVLGFFLVSFNRKVGYFYTSKWGSFGITWFDHRFDYLRGPDNWYWCERGILGNRVIKDGDNVLDVCCGDGIYSGLFYSLKAGSVDALDRNKIAIAVAKKRYSKPNVQFLIADVIEEPFPKTHYDIVTFFEAIEHFSAAAGIRLLQKIVVSLSAHNSILIGSTPILPHKGGYNPEHDNEFLSVEQLRLFLQFHFVEVDTWLSKWPTRTECYFQCSHPIMLSEEKISQAIQEYYQFLENTNKK